MAIGCSCYEFDWNIVFFLIFGDDFVSNEIKTILFKGAVCEPD